MNLVIVESPTKARTISRFLGKDFQVESSNGHVRDLPKSELGIDVEKSFEPHYVIPRKAQKNVTHLRKVSQKASRIILATDEDREGEAISWHLIQALGLKNSKSEARNSKIERIVFHEVTKKAIEEALENPREIDMNLVESQQARRILDRLVGYKLSPFLWKKLMRGLSAGRVQSVALRLIVEREEEIKKFIPVDYWTITAVLGKKASKKENFESALVKIDGKTVGKPGLTDEKQVKKITGELEKSDWRVESVEKKAKEVRPKPPFTTSTLQQASWSRLHFSAKRTMRIAQQLYEGIEIKKEGGALGLITYMRTDSFNVSESALEQARDYLIKNLGEKYALSAPKRFKTKSKGAQEAHEAIRPTHPHITPESVKNDLSPEQYKLYDLIWTRFMATQMPNAIFDGTILEIEAVFEKKNIYRFQSRGSVLKFDGFLKVYQMKIEEATLPVIEAGDPIEAKEIKPEKHQTQPPARFNDASLVKALEKHGIGRPSTYAQIISTIEARNYVERGDGKQFKPTEIGEKVKALLVEHFPQIVDINFTAEMENDLDKIASGQMEKLPLIKGFYGPFEKNLEEKYKTVEKEDLVEETEEVCGECGKKMVIRYGRFGRFLACSGFPECKNTKPLPSQALNIKCPICKEGLPAGRQGDVVERRTKRKRLFYGCSSWPKCQFATWQKPTGELCPSCQSPLVELKSGIKCSNKECDYKKPSA